MHILPRIVVPVAVKVGLSEVSLYIGLLNKSEVQLGLQVMIGSIREKMGLIINTAFDFKST